MDAPTPILRKLHKLLARAEGKGTTEAEAATSAALAADLMQRHGITRAALSASAGIEQPREQLATQHALDPTNLGRRSAAHHDSLINGLCSAFGCRWYLMGSEPILFGRLSAVQSVSYVFAYLCREIDRLCDLAVKAAQREAGRPLGAAWSRSYKIGAAQAVAGKLYEQRRKEQIKRAAAKAGQRVEVEAEPDEAECEIIGEAMAAETPAPETTDIPDRSLVVTPKAIEVIEADEAEVASEYEKFSEGFSRRATGRAGATKHDAYRRGAADGAKITISSARGALGGGAARIGGR